MKQLYSNKDKAMENVITEIIPFDHQKSFYGKAKQIKHGRTYYLLSYSTVVCSVCNGIVKRYWSGYSVTTMKHINSFLKMYGLSGFSKNDWLKFPVSKLNKNI